MNPWRELWKIGELVLELIPLVIRATVAALRTELETLRRTLEWACRSRE